MTPDEKIDEVLRIVREQEQKNDIRFSRLETRDDDLLKLNTEQRELLLEERVLNGKRFFQMETSIGHLRQDIGKMNVDLNAKIDLLSADMHGLSEDLYETKRRMTRPEKKPLS